MRHLNKMDKMVAFLNKKQRKLQYAQRWRAQRKKELNIKSKDTNKIIYSDKAFNHFAIGEEGLMKCRFQYGKYSE